jgi:MFS family permease
LRQNARILLAALVGTSVEFYDYYVFATATALVFGPMFFPKVAPSVQQIAAFMVFGGAFIARPVGAIAFGHFGDRIGRKSTLVASLMLMGASTVAVAFLPSYEQAGLLAPCCCVSAASVRASALAASGAGRLCWRWNMPRRAGRRALAARRNWERRSGFFAPMACS